MNKISVTVLYAQSPSEQVELTVFLNDGATVLEAIQTSGILMRYPNLSLDNIAVGVFSKRKKLEDTITQGDRIEIYRPLLIDPKDARRARAGSVKK